ncbi:MAG: hypothetical protein ACP5HQ_00255 [Thermoprotei archaeon]
MLYALDFTKDWDSALFELTGMLRETLKDDLVMVIGLDEGERVYDSNVLVVVKEKSDDVIVKVAKAALEVNSRHSCSVNFYVCTADEKEVIDAFLRAGHPRDCDEAFKDFESEVSKISGVTKVVRTDGYDSNVLVVVKEKSDDVIVKVAKAALEVNSRHSCSVNFYVTEHE